MESTLGLGCIQLIDAERQTLAEIGAKLGKQTLNDHCIGCHSNGIIELSLKGIIGRKSGTNNEFMNS